MSVSYLNPLSTFQCNSFVVGIVWPLCVLIPHFVEQILNHRCQSFSVNFIVYAYICSTECRFLLFVTPSITKYLLTLRIRLFLLQDKTSDTSLLVRALDRFYRRLQAMTKLLPTADFACAGNDIVLKIAKDRVQQYLETLKLQFAGEFFFSSQVSSSSVRRWVLQFVGENIHVG